MEQQPPDRQADDQLAPELEDSPEAVRIHEGIAEVLRDGGTIDDETAYLIARAITPGSGALHELALTEEITPEIGGDLEVAYEVLPGLADTWISALDSLRDSKQFWGCYLGGQHHPREMTLRAAEA